MTSTVADIIKDSMRVIGAIAKSETPPTDEMNENLRALNIMLGSAPLKRFMLRGLVNTTHTLVVGTYSYTIGTTGTIAVTKPIKIVQAELIDSDSYNHPLDIISQDDYMNRSGRIVDDGRPDALYYSPGTTQQTDQLGTIYLVPVPSYADTLSIWMQSAFTSFTALTTSINFEDMYLEAIKYNLAVRLWPEYHGYTVDVPASIAALAMESVKMLEDSNATIPTANCDLTTEAPYDIYNG